MKKTTQTTPAPKSATKSATKSEKAPKATATQKPAAETATPPTTTPQEAPEATADTKKETDTMKPDTTPDKPTADAGAVIEAPEATATTQAPAPALKKYTAAEARTPQAAEAIRRTIIRAAAAAEAVPTIETLEAYEVELRSASEATHGKPAKWTESHALARLCLQLGLTAEEAAKAKTKAKARAAMVEAAKSRITPVLAWQSIWEISADAEAAKAIYQALSDEVDGLRSELALYSAYLAETRKGGEAAGVLPTKSEEAKARAALRRVIDRRAKQRQAAEAIYYRHFAAHLEEGETAEAAKAAALETAAAYLRDDLTLTAEEAKAVWEEAAKAYQGPTITPPTK